MKMKLKVKPMKLKRLRTVVEPKLVTTNYMELKFKNLKFAKKKQREMIKDYGYKPKIFHLKDEHHYLIVKPVELIEIKSLEERK